ncbi:GNAT family N-acetyltransferase [Amnibacterium kyonggiense]
MTISFIRARSEEEWDAALADDESATPFHEWSWLQLQSELTGDRLIPLVVFEGGEPIGVFPIFTRRELAIRSLPSTFPYLGPTVTGSRLTAMIRAFRSWQLRNGLLDVHFEMRFLAEDQVGDLHDVAEEVKAERTFVIDLSHGSQEALEASFNRNARRKLKTADAAGVEVRASTYEDIRDVLPVVLAEAFRRHGGESPYLPEAGDRLARYLMERGGYAATAVHDGRPVGVRIGLERGPLALDALGAGLTEFRDLQVDAALTRDHLRWALERGYGTLDLAGHVDAGVEQFKRSFGAREVGYLGLRSSVAPWLLSIAGAVRAHLIRS